MDVVFLEQKRIDHFTLGMTYYVSKPMYYNPNNISTSIFSDY